MRLLLTYVFDDDVVAVVVVKLNGWLDRRMDGRIDEKIDVEVVWDEWIDRPPSK